MEPTKLNSFFFVGKDPPENPMTDKLDYPTHCPLLWSTS